MSVSLTSVSNPEGDCLVDLSNHTFRELCQEAKVPWNGCHDGQEYPPEQLRALAAAVPSVVKEQGTQREWSAVLAANFESLAQSGGAILS